MRESLQKTQIFFMRQILIFPLSLLHLSRLLLRLYDPIGGCVRISGTPLTDINLKWWRQQIGYVSQEPCLFPGSIRDNIAAGKDGGDAGVTTHAQFQAVSTHGASQETIHRAYPLKGLKSDVLSHEQ